AQRSQAGRVDKYQAGRYRGSGREWSGSQARDQTGEVSRGQDQAGSATSQAETGTGMQVTRYRGPWKKHTPRHRLQVWPSLKYTTCNQPQVMAKCRIEPLVVESTRWPALVLQPTRQVSPTTIGKSIPDSYT
ncbi:unnamed protein product, partial [Staurois parvus]